MKQKIQNQLNDQLQGLRRKEKEDPSILAWTNKWVVGSLTKTGKTGEVDHEGEKKC